MPRQSLRPNFPQQRTAQRAFGGGLNQTTPKWQVDPGRLVLAKNFEEPIEGGYKDIEGYERFDGRPSPSAAQYGILDVTISGEFSVGDTITGGTSGATAEVIAVVTSGTPDYLVITKISGTFQNAENLEVSASVEGTAASAVSLSGASTAKLNGQYLNLAADEYRVDISAVTGSGDILGVLDYDGTRYAFRNNAGGTAAVMFKETSAGWTSVDLGYELSFTSGGTYAPEEGDTITGATSGATAVITRVVLESGSFEGGDAAGRFIFASQAGTFQSESLDIGANTDIATIAGDSSAITLNPSGSFYFVTADFGQGERAYGCDGANRGFEFDGTVFVPIETGMPTDTPEKVIVHANHLFFSFNNSVQHSGTGYPYQWTVVQGAAEILTPDIVTGFLVMPGAQGDSSLAVFTRNQTFILYGSSVLDWNLIEYRDEVGALEGSIQQVGDAMFMDDQGLRTLRTVQEFGNFSHATWTDEIRNYINEKKTKVVASCIVRSKSQYRIFFSDKTALYVTIKGVRPVSFMPVVLDHQVTCVSSKEGADGSERIFFGSDNGYVYELDKGTSFDGGAIDAYINLHYDNLGSPRFLKAFKGAAYDAEAVGYAEFDATFQLDYGDILRVQPPAAETLDVNIDTFNYDSLNWNTFVWDGARFTPSEIDLSGSGENVSLIIRKNSDYFDQIRFAGVVYRYSPRRTVKG